MFWLQGIFIVAVMSGVSLGVAAVVMILDALWQRRRDRAAAARRAIWSPDR